jgi:hypothetical protein
MIITVLVEITSSHIVDSKPPAENCVFLLESYKLWIELQLSLPLPFWESRGTYELEGQVHELYPGQRCHESDCLQIRALGLLSSL